MPELSWKYEEEVSTLPFLLLIRSAQEVQRQEMSSLLGLASPLEWFSSCLGPHGILSYINYCLKAQGQMFYSEALNGILLYNPQDELSASWKQTDSKSTSGFWGGGNPFHV